MVKKTSRTKVVRQIKETMNYKMFDRSDDNRITDVKTHRNLQKALSKYGWIPGIPLVANRNGSNRLIVKDGQHRLEIAEILGIPVCYVEEPISFDIAEINSTAKSWTIKDRVEKYSTEGKEQYQKGLEFSSTWNVPLSKSFALLGGVTMLSNLQPSFNEGRFKIKDEEWATNVALLHNQLISVSRHCKGSRLLLACMAIFRVPEFDPIRMVNNAERCREKLVSFSTRDAYLAMLEDVYNFGRKNMFGLKAAAIMTMKDRSMIKQKKKEKTV